MEYTHILQPLILIAVSFGVGGILGAFWMFYVMLKTQNRLEKELDSKSKQLEMYENKYDDDDYEAY